MGEPINMVLVIVPVYNEEKNIGRVVRGLFEQGITQVVVVDDGSSDATGAEAARAGAMVLEHPINRGQGAALETGNEHARSVRADIVVHFDGDGQFNPADIVPAVKFLQENNLDVVIGSRFLDARSKMPWSKRYIMLPVASWINFVFTGLKLTDAHNGFRVLSARSLARITIEHDGMSHNSEIMAKVHKLRLAFKEFPVAVTYAEFGQGIGGGFKIVVDLLLSYL